MKSLKDGLSCFTSCFLGLHLEPLWKFKNDFWPLHKSYYILHTIFGSQTAYQKQQDVLLLHFHLIFSELISLDSLGTCLAWKCMGGSNTNLWAETRGNSDFFMFSFLSIFSSIQHKGSRACFSGPLSFRLHKVKKQNHLFLFLPQRAATRAWFSPKHCWYWVLYWMRLLGVISIPTGPLFYYCYI